MTDRVLPALDEKLDEKISRMIDGLITETGGMIYSDGWTSLQSRPIINEACETAQHLS